MNYRYNADEVADINEAREENASLANPFNRGVAQFNARLSGEAQTYSPFTTSFMSSNGGTIDPGLVNPTAVNQWGLPSGYAPTIDISPDQPLTQRNGEWGYFQNAPLNANGKGDTTPQWTHVPIQKIVDQNTNSGPVDPLTKEKVFDPKGAGLAARISDLLGEVGGLKISDLYDDPATKNKNENPLTALSKRYDNLTNAFGSLNADFTAPDLTSTILGSNGPLDVGDLPDLLEADLDLYAEAGSNLNEIGALIEGLRNGRIAERERIGDARLGWQTDLDRLLSTVGGLDYWEQNQIDQIKSEYNDLRSNRKRFNSPILDQVGVGDFSNVDRRLDRLGSILDGFETKRTNEENRISGFSDRLFNASDNLRDRFDGLNISNKNQLEGIQDIIRDRIRDAGRFSSNLGFNFNDEVAELSGLSSEIDQMLAERDVELERISDAKEGFATEFGDINRLLDQSDIYDMGELNSLGRRLDKFERDTSGFKSDLNFSLKDYDIDGVREGIQKLLDRRDNRLSNKTDKLDNLAQRLGGLEIQNVTKRGNILDALQDLRYDVGAFSGGKVSDILSDIDAQIDIVGEQNTALDDRRGEITDAAEALLKRLGKEDFYQQGEIDTRLDEYQALVDDAETFKTTGADTDLDAIYDLLMGNRNRLQQEAENVAGYRAADRSEVLRQLNGSDIARLAQSGTLSPEEMTQLMALIGTGSEDELTSTFGETVASNLAGVY